MRVRIGVSPVVCLVLGCDASIYLGTNDGGLEAASAGRDARASGDPRDAAGRRLEGGGPAGNDATNDTSRPPSEASSDTSVTFADAAACFSACETAAVACGEPEAGAAANCAGICSSSATKAQLLCLSTTSCAVLLQTAGGGGTVCGIGEVDSGDASNAFDAGGGSGVLLEG